MPFFSAEGAATTAGVAATGSATFLETAFGDLAEEADSLQRYTNNTDEVKRQGVNQLVYKSPAGEITVKLHKYMKQGSASVCLHFR